MIFYTPDIDGIQCVMNEEESEHAVRVLRLKAGDKVTLVDGRGGRYEAVVSNPHPKRCEVTITEEQHQYGKRPYHLHVGIAPTKNTDRFEWFVEKSVEIGIDEITPLFCDHSERKNINLQRVQRIAVAAMKQSKKAYLPRLNDMVPFEKWLSVVQTSKCYLAYCGETEKKLLKSAYHQENEVTIAIGPEGDFSPKEAEQALKHGFECISLGESRLRTETAGIVACHSIYFMNECE